MVYFSVSFLKLRDVYLRHRAFRGLNSSLFRVMEQCSVGNVARNEDVLHRLVD